MHKFAKKVYMSMLTVAIVCITMFATTYAWVGMLANSTFDSFNIGIVNSKDDEYTKEYSVLLSLTGEKGSFSSEINSSDLKRVILKNMGYNVEQYGNDSIDAIFANVNLDQATVKRRQLGFDSLGNVVYKNDFQLIRDTNGNEGYFFDMNDNITKRYFSFDLYVSVEKIMSNSEVTSDYFLDIYLTGNLFSSNHNRSLLINNFKYPSSFISNLGYDMDEKIYGSVAINAESACRLSIQKYESVPIGCPEYYTEHSEVNDLIIYEGGSQLPTYSIDNNGRKIYSFGGILPNEINLANYEWNSIYPNQFKDVPQWAINRGDIEYKYDSLNQIIDKSDKVGVNSMIKLKICFWFEGWDADCFSIIDKTPVSLNFNFTTKEKLNS